MRILEHNLASLSQLMIVIAPARRELIVDSNPNRPRLPGGVEETNVHSKSSLLSHHVSCMKSFYFNAPIEFFDSDASVNLI
jgi:hypothetical protein